MLDDLLAALPQRRVLDVGYDLDGVNFWFDRAYYRGCVTIGALEADAPRIKAQRWDFYEEYGHSTSDFVGYCHQLADLGLLWAGDVIRGAAEAWRTIHAAGHRIHVITDRSFGTHPIASHVGTRLWLAKAGLPYDSLTFTADKTSVPTDVMIEDKLENYDALAATACRPYLINRPWNAVPGDTRRRVDTHAEFARAVLLRGAGITTPVEKESAGA